MTRTFRNIKLGNCKLQPFDKVNLFDQSNDFFDFTKGKLKF